MKNPLKEVKRQLLQWGKTRLIGLHWVYNGFNPKTSDSFPDPFEADEETIKSFGNSWAVDVWHDTNPGELQIKIDFNKINSSKDLKTYVLSLIEEYLEEHPEYKKRKRVKRDKIIDMLIVNASQTILPPEWLRELWGEDAEKYRGSKDFPDSIEGFRKSVTAYLAGTAGGGPKQIGKFLFKGADDDNIHSYRKRVERLLSVDDVSETIDGEYKPFSKLTYP